MVVSTQTAIALRCPKCGKLDFYALSRFSLNGNTTVHFSCDCGTSILSVYKKSRKTYCFNVNCVMCETKHLMTYNSSHIWTNNVTALVCDHTEVEIGYMGAVEAVKNSIKKADRSIKEIADELGYEDFFLNPDIMCQVLDILHVMSEEGKMTCGCGSRELEIEVFPDRIELSCPNCQAQGILFAETIKDLQRVCGMKKIKLDAHSLKYLDQNSLKKKSPVKK